MEIVGMHLCTRCITQHGECTMSDKLIWACVIAFVAYVFYAVASDPYYRERQAEHCLKIPNVFEAGECLDNLIARQGQ